MSARHLIAAICAALALPFLPVPPAGAASSAEPMVIHGTITGPGGQIITDAWIELHEQGSTRGFGADSTGHFAYGPLSAGDYRVRASAGPGWAPEFYVSAITREQATVIHVTQGAVVDAADIELDMGGRIEGHLTGPGGVPAPNLVAQAYRHNPDSDTEPWTLFGGAFANAAGLYSITGLPDGDYRVHFRDQTYPSKYMNEIYDDDVETIVTIVGGATVTGIDGELAEGGHIVGKITGSGGGPLSASATLHDATTGNYLGRDQADSQGNYDLQGLASGNYKVSFQSNDNSHLPEFYQDASTLADAEIIPVTLGSTTTLDAELAPASRIIGKAVGPDGSNLANIRVDAWRHTPGNVEPWQSWEQAETETDGTFQVGGLPAGTYRLEFSDPDQVHSQEFYPDKDTLLEAVDLTVGDDATLELPAVAALDLSGRISGTVTAPPSTEPRVLAHRKFGSEWRLVGSWEVDEGGSYEMIGLRAGTFRVEFNDSTTNLSRYWAGSTTFDRATDIVVRAGAEVTGVDGTLIESPPTPMPTPAPAPASSQPPTPVTVPSVQTLAALTLPRIRGVAKIGRTLKVTSGRWSTATVTHKIHWLANGRVIKKATRSRFALTVKQKGKKITVRVTASAAGYLPVTVTTEPTIKVAARRVPT